MRVKRGKLTPVCGCHSLSELDNVLLGESYLRSGFRTRIDAGKRHRNFATYEQRTLGAMLLKEWEWTLPKDSEHKGGIKNGFSPFALSLPKDLFIDFKRRV